MGYRSQVVFAIRGEKDAITTFLVKMRLTLPDVAEDPCWEHIRVTPDGTVIHFHAQDWKWYADYASVQFFEEFWSAAEEFGDNPDLPDSFKLDGAFVRLGEEDADIETRCFGNEPYDLVSVSRNIDCSYL